MGLKLHEKIPTRRLFHLANPELVLFKGVERATETATEKSISQVDSVIVE